MDPDKLFQNYQKAVDAMSDKELCAKFAAMGCDVYVDTPVQAVEKKDFSEVNYTLDEITACSFKDVFFADDSSSYMNCGSEYDQIKAAADSNELALAA